jgi:hypothetical protein
MAMGFCVSQYVADRVIAFINALPRPELHVGPIRVTGEESDHRELGRKGAAPALRVPKREDPANLRPCY